MHALVHSAALRSTRSPLQPEIQFSLVKAVLEQRIADNDSASDHLIAPCTPAGICQPERAMENYVSNLGYINSEASDFS